MSKLYFEIKKKIDVLTLKSYYRWVLFIFHFMFSLITLAVNTYETFKYDDAIAAKLFNLIVNFRRYPDTEILVLFYANLVIIIPTNGSYEIIYIHSLKGLVTLDSKEIDELTRIIRLSNVRTIFGSKMSNKSLKDYKEALKSLESEIQNFLGNKKVGNQTEEVKG